MRSVSGMPSHCWLCCLLSWSRLISNIFVFQIEPLKQEEEWLTQNLISSMIWVCNKVLWLQLSVKHKWFHYCIGDQWWWQKRLSYYWSSNPDFRLCGLWFVNDKRIFYSLSTPKKQALMKLRLLGLCFRRHLSCGFCLDQSSFNLTGPSELRGHDCCW